jgi:hypothetical protein
MKRALKMMLWTKIKTAALPSLAALLILSSAVYMNHSTAMLYHQFVNDPKAPIFIHFERKIIVPKPTFSDGEKVTLPNGSVSVLNIPEHQFFAFCKSGRTFVIAISTTPIVNSSSAFTNADELIGFDGETYWRFRPRSVQTVSANKSVLFDVLTIFSDSDGHNNQASSSADIELDAIKGEVEECFSVAQFGYTNSIENSPHINGSEMIAKNTDGQQQSARLNFGGGDIPSTFEYKPTNAGTLVPVTIEEPGQSPVALKLFPLVVSVAIDTQTETLTITRSSKNHVVNQTQYHLLSVQKTLDQNIDSLFSWRTYLRNITNTIGILKTNGASWNISFEKDGTVRPMYKMDKP